MSATALRDSRTWLEQAASDLRTAQALLDAPGKMLLGDVGCHVAALCAQSIEKSLKGYLLLNQRQPRLGHRPDKYLPSLLARGDPLLRYREHHPRLCRTFDSETRGVVRRLLDLTPGGLGQGKHHPNTEYPWGEGDEWPQAPCAAAEFADRAEILMWTRAAQRVVDELSKLRIAVARVQGR
jgi:hypothetical protein